MKSIIESCIEVAIDDLRFAEYPNLSKTIAAIEEQRESGNLTEERCAHYINEARTATHQQHQRIMQRRMIAAHRQTFH